MNETFYFSRVIIPGDKGIVKALEEAHNLIFRTNPTSGPVSQEKSDSSEVCRILMDGLNMEEQSGFFTPVKKLHVFVRLWEKRTVSQTFLTDVTFMGCAPVCYQVALLMHRRLLSLLHFILRSFCRSH